MPLDRPVAEILHAPGRDWTPKPPAEPEEIAELRTLVPFVLPPEYVDLLRYGDGGYGELDAPPLYFCMDSIAETVEHNEVWRTEGEFQSFWFIGGNGGLESIAFDLRTGPPYPIVMIDCIAGESSAVQIAADVCEFINRMGIASDHVEPQPEPE
jgi:hypothetical protein